MTTADALFDDQRGYLFAIAYRMLGSAADADDLVQDAWLRWQRRDRADVENPKAYLARVVTRLALDRLRALKRRREDYVGPWLPEPVPAAVPDPAELADSLSLGFLLLLERLTPVERAVFLLRQVFGYDYAEIAVIVEKSEANCRQSFSRAAKHIERGRPRFETSADAQRRLLERFIEATQSGDLGRFEALLREDVQLWSDGGGKVPAAMRVIIGREMVARLLHGLATKALPGAELDHATVNGQRGVVVRRGGQLESIVVVDSIDGEAHTICIVRNPDKLAAWR